MFLTKRMMVIVTMIIASMVLYIVFPAESIFQDILMTVTFLVGMPLLSFRFVLNESVTAMGVGVGHWKVGLLWSMLSFAAALVFFLILMRFTAVGELYELPLIVQDRFFLFLAYSGIFSINIAAIIFFLTGVIGNVLRAEIGIIVVAVQFIVLVLLIGWDVTMTPLFVVAPFAALTAYYSRSVYYAIGVSALFVTIANAIVIALNR